MERITGREIGKAQQSETKVSLSKVSPAQLPISSVKALAVLMAQTAAYFPHQAIPPETSKVWLGRWAELTMAYGLDIFEASLSKVVHGSEFLPLPTKIETECKVLHANKISREAQERRRVEHEHYEQQLRTHPEEFVHLSDIAKEVVAKQRVQGRVN